MKLLAYLRSLADRFFHRDRLEDELDEELREHIQLRADDLERSGFDRAAAERRARIEFGGQSRFKEEARDAMAGRIVETLIKDLRFSIRQLRKSPSFAIAAVATLAVAIGANAVVFSAVNGFILRPLGLPNEERLYTIERASGGLSSESYPNYLDLRDRNRSFEQVAAWFPDQVWLETDGTPSRAWAYEVSGNYFDMLGVEPYRGRLLHASDEHGANSAPYIVLAWAYWHARFQDDRGVIGRTVRVNRHPFTIIGVAPPGFRGTVQFFAPDFFVPVVNQEQLDGSSFLTSRASRAIGVSGQLKAGVTPAQATADLNAIGSALEKAYPADDAKMSFLLTRSAVGDAFEQPIHAFLTALMLLAGLILLAACANLGSLFAARAAHRSREIALRLALGAGRARILRQLFTEAVLVALIGGGVGLWGSVMLLHWLVAWQPVPQFPIYLPIDPDARVYAAAMLLSVVSGFLFGAVPVRQVFRTDPYEIVKSGSPTPRGRRVTMRDLLLAVQVTICALLVTSSIVAARGLARSLHAKLGIEPQHVVLVQTDLRPGGYSAAQTPLMQDRMIDAMQSIPGVESVGLVGEVPPLHMGWRVSTVFAGDANDLRASKAVAHANVYSVSPDYFRAAGTAMLFGRTFTSHDDDSAPRVAVVNGAFARKVFGGESTSAANAADAARAVGRYFKLADGTRVQIVGLVEDGKYTANLAEEEQVTMFLPIRPSPWSDSWLVVRSTRDPRQLSAAIRDKLHDLDPGLPSLIHSWTQDMDAALFAPRMAAATLGVLGVMGAIVAITGIFGMAAYSLSKRLKELGIRIALGARRLDVLSAALGRAVKLLAFGSAAGLLLGVLASRVLAFIVWQATPRDPVVLAGVVVAMLGLGLLATWVPAQRALAVDPANLLREE